MKKTVSVNIKGLNFLIEEDAYESLQLYMDRLSDALRNDKGKNEIMEDIELRLAELFSTKLNEKKQVIELEDIQSILETLGDPSLFLDDEQNEEFNDKKFSDTHEKINTEKRLFRDTDNASIAGVCAGVANYFNIDVVIIRALFLIVFFFGGFGFPLYFILWIVVPKAKNTIDKLRMKGKPINVDSVKEEVENATERLEKRSSSLFNKFRNDESISRKFTSIGRVITFLVSIGAIAASLFFLIIFLIFVIGGLQFIPVQSHTGFLSLSELGELIFANTRDFSWFYCGLTMSAASFILILLLFGIKLLFRLKSKWSRIIFASFLTTGMIGIILCMVIGTKTSAEMAIEGEIERDIACTNAEELFVIPMNHSDLRNKDFKVISDGGLSLVGLSANRIVESGIYFQYRPSKDSLFHIIQHLGARGRSHKNALSKARNIEHKLSLSKETISINTSYSFPLKDKLRDQEVTIIIEIPIGKQVNIEGYKIGPGIYQSEGTSINDLLEQDGYLEGNGDYDHWN
jgi:phage shock protein PspC (stress-responsive transcriptional regulator)